MCRPDPPSRIGLGCVRVARVRMWSAHMSRGFSVRSRISGYTRTGMKTERRTMLNGAGDYYSFCGLAGGMASTVAEFCL